MSKATPTTKPVVVAYDAELHVKPIEFAESLGIRPQMVYNYIKNGRFPEGTVVEAVIETVTGEGDEQVTKSRKQNVLVRENAAEWATQYTERKQARAAKREEQLKAELAGEA